MKKKADKAEKKVEVTDEKKFLDLATKRLKREIDADDHNRQAAIEDLKFLNGDQWDEGEKKRRTLAARPCLMINELPKYVNQVVGDMRHNRARIKVIPASPDATPSIANIRQSLINEIEYNSNAEAIYDYAGEMEVSCGYGAWRVLTRYCEDDPFLQEIYEERIRNPFLVYMDSSATSEVYADAKYGFVLEKVTKEEFEERFPDKDVPSDALKTGKGTGLEVWFASDAFFVADYYVVESEKKSVCLMKDGSTMDRSEVDEKLAERSAATKKAAEAQAAQQLAAIQQAAAMGQPVSPLPAPVEPPLPPSLTVSKTRTIDVPRVRWYAITADQILDGPKDIPGRYIPVILVRGPDRNIEGKTFVRSLIRDAKDPQRMLNFWVTDASEIVDMIPKAPWIGTAKQFEGYENDYAAANAINFPFLKYNVDKDETGQAAPPPRRVDVGQVPVGVFQQIPICQQAIRDAIGMYKADVGDQGPERTGKAIIERQKPGDVSTFCFIDNLNRGIAHCGKIINHMIPEVYDTDRDVPIRTDQDQELFMPVNTTAGNALERVKQSPDSYPIDLTQLQKAARSNSDMTYNALKEGSYDVHVKTGPNYATQRQETSDRMMQLSTVNPAIAKIGGDILVRNMDFEGADELADRLEATLPPGMVLPKPGKPKRQMPPNPQVMIAAEELKVQQADLEVKKMGLEVKKAELQVKKIKAAKELTDTKGETRKMLLDLMSQVLGPEQAGPARMDTGFK